MGNTKYLRQIKRMKKIFALYTFVFVVLVTVAVAEEKDEFVTIVNDIGEGNITIQCGKKTSRGPLVHLPHNERVEFSFYRRNEFNSKIFEYPPYYCDITTRNGSGTYGVWTKRLNNKYCNAACSW